MTIEIHTHKHISRVPRVKIMTNTFLEMTKAIVCPSRMRISFSNKSSEVTGWIHQLFSRYSHNQNNVPHPILRFCDVFKSKFQAFFLLQYVSRKGLGSARSADSDTIYTIYLSHCTQTAVPKFP